jgi:hypothetical protein
MRRTLSIVLASLLFGCAAPPAIQPDSNNTPNAASPLPFKDHRPAQERKSLIELEAYRTQIALADDVLSPSPPVTLAQALRRATPSVARGQISLTAFRVQISLPASRTTPEIYRAMNLPNGPPNLVALLAAISNALATGQITGALVVCEVEASLAGVPHKSLVRESYARDLTLQALMGHVNQAAVELVSELQAAK